MPWPGWLPGLPTPRSTSTSEHWIETKCGKRSPTGGDGTVTARVPSSRPSARSRGSKPPSSACSLSPAEGGRIAVATSQPASLLPLARAFAEAATAAGGDILTGDEFRLPGRGDRALWWHDQVAVVAADGALVRDDGLEAGDEWLFAVGRPDLVVADRGFAAAGLAAGHETIALADLDALAFGVAQRRGLPVRLVPLAMGCPPAAYAP